MSYLGGKSLFAKDIAAIINKYTQGKYPFVSLFCGMCSIESLVKSPNKYCNDIQPYLIEMWKGAQQGYKFPDSISENQYYYIKQHQDDDKCLSGFVGFGCSFGGKWWAGVARDKTEQHNFAANHANIIYKSLKGLSTTTFICSDYRDVIIPKDAVIYCDPPYTETTGYCCGKFDTRTFWEYIYMLSDTHIVLVSEQTAPRNFLPIYSKQVTRALDHVNDCPNKIIEEKLFQRSDKIKRLW